MVSLDVLLTQRVAVHVSDPWEFGTAHGCGPFPGRVVAVDSVAAILFVELDLPLEFEGVRWQVLACSARHVGTPLTALGKECVSCSFLAAVGQGDSWRMPPRGSPHLIGSVSVENAEL